MSKRIELAGLPWFSFTDMARGRQHETLNAPHAACLGAVFDWTRTFLMAPHAELGRMGDVCPFTAQAARIDTLRFASSDASSLDPARARQDMLEAFAAFDRIPVLVKMANFRAVLVAFPHCADDEGLAMLAQVQKSLRRLSFRQGRMIGLFHDGTAAPGLWNADFRPLRAPVPLLAIRALVAQDAAFVRRHPLLAPTYLARFRLSGARRLLPLLLRRA
jgi:hypothetical protein